MQDLLAVPQKVNSLLSFNYIILILLIVILVMVIILLITIFALIAVTKDRKKNDENIDVLNNISNGSHSKKETTTVANAFESDTSSTIKTNHNRRIINRKR